MKKKILYNITGLAFMFMLSGCGGFMPYDSDFKCRAKEQGGICGSSIDVYHIANEQEKAEQQLKFQQSDSTQVKTLSCYNEDTINALLQKIQDLKFELAQQKEKLGQENIKSSIATSLASDTKFQIATLQQTLAEHDEVARNEIERLQNKINELKCTKNTKKTTKRDAK